jgi:RNA polymerase sigma factor (TIGR02999 family)
MAGGYFKAQHASHTLQPTALVHEAYLKLVGSEQDWKSRPHFCAVAATAMRQILMDHARGKRRAKRAGNVVDVTIDDLATPGGTPLDLVALDDAMAKLAQMQERSARIVELRFFGGLTNPEISQVMGVSTATVERDWRHARAWLRREFGEIDS